MDIKVVTTFEPLTRKYYSDQFGLTPLAHLTAPVEYYNLIGMVFQTRYGHIEMDLGWSNGDYGWVLSQEEVDLYYHDFRRRLEDNGIPLPTRICSSVTGIIKPQLDYQIPN